ncbi:vWA domain-containing protein [Streptomyces melanogenes]|uniref:vWA domain-containing protein n=1 Tax=Streptomyces melanogenes TaxID=67326 RepID=UPI0037AE70C8
MDIVLCVDVTGSMAPVLNQVKEGALSFHGRLKAVMGRRGMDIGRMRLRVIAFRDFGADRDRAIESTSFLDLPEQDAEFAEFIAGLRATGGGDVPESGLEALALAVRSPWSAGTGDRRHIVVLFTDAPAHPLGGHTPRRRAAKSPSDRPPWWSSRRRAASASPSADDVFPRTFGELHDQWGREGRDGAVMDQSAKRLLIFAPEQQPWRDIAETWDKTLFVPSVAGTGLKEIALDEVISTIARNL